MSSVSHLPLDSINDSNRFMIDSHSMLQIVPQRCWVGRLLAHRCYAYKNDANLIKWINQQLDFLPQEGEVSTTDKTFLAIGNKILKDFAKNNKFQQLLVTLDHRLGKIRKRMFPNNKESPYQLEINQVNFKKWEKFKFSTAIYSRHTEFVEFLHRSHLFHQIRITPDRIQEIDGEPALLVNGQWTKYSEFTKEFVVVGTKKPVIYKKADPKATREVYSFLGTGKGLVKFDPTKNGFINPINRLTESEYKKAAELANRYPGRTLNPEDSILQVFTLNKIHENSSNCRTVLPSNAHAYIRMINPKGEVYGVGFQYRAPYFAAFKSVRGTLRSPDIGELTHRGNTVITHIPISPEEVERLNIYINSYIRHGKTVYNRIRQNCIFFVKHAIAYATKGKIDMPTSITIPKLLMKIAPEWMQAIGRFFKMIGTKVCKFFACILPTCIKKTIVFIAYVIKEIFSTILAIILLPVALFLGGAQGTTGPSFEAPDENNLTKTTTPFLRNLWNWFRLSAYTLHLPSVTQEWQLRTAPDATITLKG